MQMHKLKCVQRFDKATQVYENCIGFLSRDLSSTKLINDQIFTEINILILQLAEEFCETPKVFDFSENFYSEESRPIDLSEIKGREKYFKNLKKLYENSLKEKESLQLEELRCKESLLRLFRSGRFTFIENNSNPVSNLKTIDASLLGDLSEIYKYTLGKLYHFLQFQLDEEKNPLLRDDRLRHIQLLGFEKLSVIESYNKLHESEKLNLIDVRLILEKLAKTNDIKDIIYISKYSGVPTNIAALRCMPYIYYKETNSKQKYIEKIAREIFTEKLCSLYGDVINICKPSNIREFLDNEFKAKIASSFDILTKLKNFLRLSFNSFILKRSSDKKLFKLFENHRNFLINQIQSDVRFVDAYLALKILEIFINNYNYREKSTNFKCQN